jgi:hypothetical protein
MQLADSKKSRSKGSSQTCSGQILMIWKDFIAQHVAAGTSGAEMSRKSFVRRMASNWSSGTLFTLKSRDLIAIS